MINKIINKVLNESVNSIIREGVESTKLTNRLIKVLYKVFQPYSSHLCHDMDWSNVSVALKALKETQGVSDVTSYAGEYHNYLNGDPMASPSRTYKLVITTEFNTTIEGVLTCHSAGTVEDPFDRYDMTISLWRGTNNEEF